MKFRKIIGRGFYEIIARYLPGTVSIFKIGQKQIRYLCVKQFIKKCGKNVNIDRNVTISKECSIGSNSGIGRNSFVGITVSIGDDVMIGSDCLILTRNHNFNDLEKPMRMQGYSEEKPVNIGNDVWIGSRVTILSGVNIGNHSIVGAGAVVTHDVEDYCIVAGNPAKVIRNRKNQ